jgi:hypothetical protein
MAEKQSGDRGQSDEEWVVVVNRELAQRRDRKIRPPELPELGLQRFDRLFLGFADTGWNEVGPDRAPFITVPEEVEAVEGIKGRERRHD